MISVIIPEYNTDPVLLDRCISSLINQTYSEWEALIVDDGSNDKSTLDYLTHVEDMDSRLRVIFSEHQGASKTRKRGIEEARGDHIAFLDSDDEVFPYFLENAYNELVSASADIVFGGIINYESGKEVSRHQSEEERLSFRDDEVSQLCKYIASGGCPKETEELRNLGSKALVSKLYKRDLFSNMENLDNDFVFGEDVYVNLALVMRAHHVVVLREPWYKRNVNQGSTSYSFHPNGISEALESAIAIAKFVSNDVALEEAALTRVLTSAALGISSQAFHKDSHAPFSERVRAVEKTLEDPWVSKACAKVRLSHYCKSGRWMLLKAAYRLRSPLLYALVESAIQLRG